MNETIVRLVVTSVSHTPQQIAELLGIIPDRSWSIGDRRPKTSIEEKNNGWVVNAKFPVSATLQEKVEALLRDLASATERIRRLSDQDDVLFSCVVYAAAPPALYFDKQVLRRISALGASLDIDLYILGGEGEELQVPSPAREPA